VTLPLLIDRENRVADDFEAKTNSQAFLIDPNHIPRYHGGQVHPGFPRADVRQRRK